MSRDSLSARGALLPIDHFLGGLAGYHYVAFTKIPLLCSRPLGFASRTKIVLPKGVANKTESKEPRHPTLSRASTMPQPPLMA
jgi:hypothetical protein